MSFEMFLADVLFHFVVAAFAVLLLMVLALCHAVHYETKNMMNQGKWLKSRR